LRSFLPILKIIHTLFLIFFCSEITDYFGVYSYPIPTTFDKGAVIIYGAKKFADPKNQKFDYPISLSIILKINTPPGQNYKRMSFKLSHMSFTTSVTRV
jgi:hypothetical protein